MEDHSVEPQSEFSNLLADLEQAAQKPAKKRLTKVSIVIDKINSKSYQNGLSALDLDKLIDIIILPNQLDQSSRINLIRNLYPIDKISKSVFFRVVASLGHGITKAPYSTQAMLLKWLIMTHDTVEDPTVFSQVYNHNYVTFYPSSQDENMFDLSGYSYCEYTYNIQTYVCTKTFFIMELIQQTGNEPALIGLLKVFKIFVPDVIFGHKADGYAPLFTHPNPEWRDRLDEIQKQALLLKMQDTLVCEDKNCRLFKNRGIYTNKISKIGLPVTETSHTQESSITLEEIENIHGLVRYFERIHVPNQLVAMLGDPLLQKFLQLRSSESDLKRIDHWLLAFFEDKLSRGCTENGDVSEILRLILEYTNSSKKIPSACISYIKSMIPTWNGLRDRDIILDLLVYTQLDSFEDIFENLLSPLEEAILSDGSVDSKLALLKFYTALLNRWTIGVLIQPESASIIEASVTALVKHANDLALTILQISNSVSKILMVLIFYEAVAVSTQNIALHSSLYLVLPHPEAIYLLCFTSSLSVLSSICGVLAIYKRLLDDTSLSGRIKITISCLEHFNAYLIDICNCLWRDRAFNTKDLNTKGCLLSTPVVDELSRYLVDHSNNLVSLQSTFNFSFSPVTCLLAMKCFRREENLWQVNDGLEDEMVNIGPVTQSYLKNLRRRRKEELGDDRIVISWHDYKLAILDYLEEMGAPGISDLIHSTLKNLSNRPREVKTL